MKKLNISTILKSFEGNPIKDNEKELTLKDGLIVYIRNSTRMGLSDADQNTLYTVGFLIGTETGIVTFTSDQYDALKRMCDNGKIKGSNGAEEAIYGSEVKGQIKELVDKAESVEEKKAEAAK